MALAVRIASSFARRKTSAMGRRGYAAQPAPVKAAAPAAPAVSLAQLGQRLVDEELKNPQPFTRAWLSKTLETTTKAQMQQQIAALKAAYPKININEDLANDPEIAALIRQIQDLPKTTAARLLTTDIRERLGATIPLPKIDDVPSPRFFFEVMRIAEEEGWHMIKARTLELFLDTTADLIAERARAEERAKTDVVAFGVKLPVEVVQSVAFQAYQQGMEHILAQFERSRQIVETSLKETQAYRQDLIRQRESLADLSVADVASQYPQWTADAFKAQEEHRWFEKAMEDEDDEPDQAAGHGHDNKH